MATDAFTWKNNGVLTLLNDVTTRACVFLLTASADVNAANSNGKTPLMFASQLRSDPDVAALLLQRDADVNATTHRGHTALLYACGRGHESCLRLTRGKNTTEQKHIYF